MKILFISEGYGIGGTTRVMSSLCDIFTNNEFQIDILVPNYRCNEVPKIPDKCNFYYIAKDNDLKNKVLLSLDLIKFLVKLIKLSKLNQYDYIISFWNYVNLLLILMPLNPSTKKIVCSHISFESLKPHWRFLTRIIYPYADSVVVLNEREEKIFSKFCKKVSIIENPLPNLSKL